MNEELDALDRVRTRKRRWIATAVTGAVLLGVGCVALPPVIDAVRYQALAASLQGSRGQMEAAQSEVTDAQKKFDTEAAAALPVHGSITAFVKTVDPSILADTDALSKLQTVQGTIAELAGIHTPSYKPGTVLTYQPAPAPRIPAVTDPSTVGGLNHAVEQNDSVISDFTAKAEELTQRAGDIVSKTKQARSLIEDVLESAAEYGSGTDLADYDRATDTARRTLRTAVKALTIGDLDPVSRFTDYAKAVTALKASHAQVIADEKAEKEREEAREAAEQKKLEDAIKAAEKAKAEAEEAKRLAEEEAKNSGNTPTPTPTLTPTPTPTPAPTPSPTPTPTPTPEPGAGGE